jgi:hypothetical protein
VANINTDVPKFCLLTLQVCRMPVALKARGLHLHLAWVSTVLRTSK